MQFAFNTATSGDPGTGKFLYDNATIASVANVNINYTDGNSANQSAFEAIWANSTTTASRGFLILKDNSNSGTTVNVMQITGAVVDHTTYKTVPVSYVSGALPANNLAMTVNWSRTGDLGATGATGPTGVAGATGPTGPTGPAPVGSPAEIVGYSTTSVTEAETVTGAGDCATMTFSRTGANAYRLTSTCLSSNGNLFTSAAFGTALNLTAPPAIGATTPSTGRFTSLGVNEAAPATSGYANFSLTSIHACIASVTSGYGGIHFNTTGCSSASSTNYSLLSDGTSTFINAPTGQITFGVANVVDFTISSAGDATLNSGHTISSHGGAVPTISAGCGTSPSAIVGTNNQGNFTIGSGGTATSCTISFSAAGVFATAPTCIFSDASASVTPVAFATGATSTSSVVVDFVAATGASKKVNYICIGG